MQVDLILFAGQSNMAGRGVTSERWPEQAPKVIEGAGWEYRAVSAPHRLWPIVEPFGVGENRPDGINDRWGEVRAKTGSLVSAFVNAYYRKCGMPVVAVSASKGGSAIAEWQPGGVYLTDAMNRLLGAKNWLQANGYEIRHQFCAWCQGETDGDLGTSKVEYFRMFDAMLAVMVRCGIEKLFQIRIGQCNIPGAETRYQPMIEWQDQLAATDDRVIQTSVCLSEMQARGMMKDDFHYYQKAYNEAGEEAGSNAAKARQMADCQATDHSLNKDVRDMEFIVAEHAIYYDTEGKTLAEITFWETEPGLYCINHTFSDPSLKGQGIGSKLVEMAVQEIRRRGGQVTATCNFAKAWIEKHPEAMNG